MKLENKIALITGSGSGIGRATARLFAKEGAIVIVNDISEENARETVHLIESDGGHAEFRVANVANSDEVSKMIVDIVQRYKHLDILFNNAGVSCVGAVEEVSEEQWDRTMNVNVKGVFLPCKYVVPVMMKQKSGCIINMSSAVAEIGLMKRAVYAATKGAVLALTKNMQVDCAPYGIRVNALLPGTILSPFVEKYLRESYADPEEGMQTIRNRQLSGDLGRPEDVAKAALFLASDDASFMMGSPFYIDGGCTFGKYA